MDFEQLLAEREQKREQMCTQLVEQFVRNNLMSDEFLDFMNANAEPYNRLMAYYRCAIMEVETKFRVLNEEFNLKYDANPIESIKSRVKSTDSLLRKMRKKNIPLTLDAIEANIWDMAGIRVICSFPDDIYLMADCLLKQDDITLVERKDYIQNPKPSGYRSLHLIVEVPIFLQNEKRNMKVEVQLRTIAMDFWASLEHKLKYKKNIPADQMDVLTAELVQCAKESAELDLRMQAVRNHLRENNEKEEENTVQPMLPFFDNLAPFRNLANMNDSKK